MDAFEAFHDDRFDALQFRPLRRPIPRTAHTVIVPRENNGGDAVLGVVHRRLVDGRPFLVGILNRESAFNARQHEVFDAFVGECPASHHAIVAAPCAVRIEVSPLNAVIDEVLSRGTFRGDCPGGRDMVGGDGIAENAEDARPFDVGYCLRLRLKVLKEWRFLHVCTLLPPRVERPIRAFEVVPFRHVVAYALVGSLERGGIDRLTDEVGYLRVRGPNVPQIDRLAIVVMS